MRGLFVGRFQPLHNGHVSIIESALDDVDRLVVVIGSAECSFSPENPFTAGERMEMIIRWIGESGLSERVIPVPVRDVNRYSVWVDHVCSYVPPFDHVYTNNPLTTTLFSEKGHSVRSTPLVDRKELSGIRIRERMLHQGKWKHLVPAPVSDYIEEIDGIERLRAISGGGDRP